MIPVADGAHEQCDTTDLRSGDETERLVDIERGLADADLTNRRSTSLGWHASTLVPGPQIPTRLQGAIRARDVRAADLQEKPTKSSNAKLVLRESRFVGFDEDGGSSTNIAASAASHQTQRAGQ